MVISPVDRGARGIAILRMTIDDAALSKEKLLHNIMMTVETTRFHDDVRVAAPAGGGEAQEDRRCQSAGATGIYMFIMRKI